MACYGNIILHFISTGQAYLLKLFKKYIKKKTVELFNYSIFNYYQKLRANKK